MTTVASLRRKLQSIHPEGRILVYIEGQQEPPHTDKDILVVFSEEDLKIL